MTKILHIGPTRDAHVAEMIKQIKERTNFDNVILSPTDKHYWSTDDFYSTIKIHVCKDFLVNNENMRSFVSKVLQEEKPDIIIGHSLSEVSVCMNYALSILPRPALATIWGAHDCIKSFRTTTTKTRFLNNLTVLPKLNYLLATNKVLISAGAADYEISKNDFVEALYPINLEQYTTHVPKTTIPVVLLGKSRGEEYIYPGLPKIFTLFPKLEVHALKTDKSVYLAKKVGIYDKIIYHDYPLTQERFAELIKRCNIVYTLTGDPGTGATALQVSYAGCVNLMRRCTTSKGILEDITNVIMCAPNSTDVTNRLAYSIRNLPKLCQRFKENNRHLIKYDKERTWPILYGALLNCLNSKKNKIVSTHPLLKR